MNLFLLYRLTRARREVLKLIDILTVEQLRKEAK